MESVFPIRLKQTRLMRGMSMDALCTATGNQITKQSIHKYESGQMMPGSRSLVVLSNALNVPIDYFFTPVSFNIEHIEFRKKQKLSVARANKIKEEVRFQLEKYFEIESISNIHPEIQKIRYSERITEEKDIYPVAERLRETWKLGEDGICNLIEILEENGIKVIEVDEADDAFDGLSGMVDDKKPVIVLNRNFTNERKRFTALHELGHLILNIPSDIEPKQKEKLCNIFASEMLISKEMLMKKMGGNRKSITLHELIGIQEQFGISIDAIMYRAKEIGIVSETGYRNFCKKKNAQPRLKQEIEKSRTKTESSTRFVSLVYRALLDEIISLSKAAALLGKSIHQVRAEINPVM